MATKKYEINQEEIEGTDLVLTLYELEEYIHKNNIKYSEIKEDAFDRCEGEKNRGTDVLHEPVCYGNQ